MSRAGKDADRRVKTARGRTASSTRWLERQLNDPYVKQAKAEGYRSRAAYKLIELDERFALLKGATRVVDLGAGWGWLAAQVLKREGVEAVHLVEADAEALDCARLNLRDAGILLGIMVDKAELLTAQTGGADGSGMDDEARMARLREMVAELAGRAKADQDG